MSQASVSKQAVFFTQSFPHGIGEQWKQTEIDALIERDWDVHVVPLERQGVSTLQGISLPRVVTLHDALLSGRSSAPRLAAELPYLTGDLPHALRARSKLQAVRSLIGASRERARILSAASTLRLPRADWRVLYFFWGRGAAEALPQLATMLRSNRTVVRLHGFDLYEHRSSSGFLPFRSAVHSADRICVVSQHGFDYLLQRAPQLSDRTEVRRLGCLPADRPTSSSTDGTLRVVSCSSLTPIKRVHEIPRLLDSLDLPRVEWTHLGDGPERGRVERALGHTPRVHAHLHGWVRPDDVPRIYADGTFDLFVNVSASEGVPISIMEALAAGIPVIASDVGGTSEIVDAAVGALIRAEISTHDFLSAVRKLSVKSRHAAASKRARERHSSMCHGPDLARSLIAEVFEHQTTSLRQ